MNHNSSSDNESSSGSSFDEHFIEQLDATDIRRPKLFQNRRHPLEIYSDEEFEKRYRFTRNTFHHVLELFKDDITPKDNRGDPVPVEDRLLITLRYYATGSFQTVLSDLIAIDQATVCRIVNQTTLAIAMKFHQFIKTPTPEQQKNAARGFHLMHGFPLIAGLIDGTQIPIASPEGEKAELFRNRKGWFAINCQFACDHEYRIIDLVARWHGSVHDQTILNFSLLKKKCERGDFGRYFFLGDNGYANKRYLLTPILNPTTDQEKTYNAKHKSTRNLVERAIGIWKKRFPVIAVKMRQRLKNSLKVIVATAILHNIAVDRNEPDPPEVEIEIPQMYLQRIPSVLCARECRADLTTRNEIVRRF